MAQHAAPVDAPSILEAQPAAPLHGGASISEVVAQHAAPVDTPSILEAQHAAEEIRRRAERVRAGEKGIPWTDVKAEVLAAILRKV